MPWDQAASHLGGSDRSFVRVEVRNVTLAEGLLAMLEPLGLTFKVNQDGQIVVGPK